MRKKKWFEKRINKAKKQLAKIEAENQALVEITGFNSLEEILNDISQKLCQIKRDVTRAVK